MEKERLKQIGSFLNDRLIVHRNVENNTPWTTEEKMIKELYDSYLDLLIENNKQQEVIKKIQREVDKIFKEYQPFNRAVLLTMLENINNYIKEV